MPDVFAVRDDGVAFVAGLDDARARTRALERVTRTLAADGQLTAWRDERYAVAPAFAAPPWFELERAAARYFGSPHARRARQRPRAARRRNAMWIARRSPTKAIDPDRLDNLVAGGVAAGQSVAATVVKEAWEEAGIAAAVAALAQRAGAVRICRAQPDGLQRETIFVHDLWLPADFVPAGQDGEVAGLSARAAVRRGPAHRERPTAPTSSPPTPRSSCSIACCAMARSRRTRRTAVRWKRPAIRRSHAGGARPARCQRRTPPRAGLTCRMPISRSVSRTALTACRISSGPIAPMQPTRNVSTCVSLPG